MIIMLNLVFFSKYWNWVWNYAKNFMPITLFHSQDNTAFGTSVILTIKLETGEIQ